MEKKEKVQPTLLTVYDEDLARLASRVGKDRALSTLRSLRQGRGYVAKFLKEQMELDDMALERLTPMFIHDFSIWLSTGLGLHGGTVWLACQQLKGVVTRAHGRGLLPWNPFSQFHIAKNIRPRLFMTEEELAALYRLRLPKAQLCRARDIFLFAAFTGLAFADLRELRWEQVVKVGGAHWILSRRQKTKVPFQVKLLPAAEEIIHRQGQRNADHVFGDLQYRTLLKQVKRVAALCGIQKDVGMHTARHSFAVLALDKGMPIESVSRILGHTNITTTQIYARITMQKLDRDMTLLGERLQLIKDK